MDENKDKDKQNCEDSSKSEALDDSPTEEFPLTSPLETSWSSEKSSNGTEGGTKRQRTETSPSPPGHRTPSPHGTRPMMVAASPPKFVSIEQILKAADGVKNMALAHEIAVDNNFKLEKLEQPGSSLEKQVRDVMQKAFWDALSEKLREDPPDFSHALVLLQEVKENLLELLLPQQKFRSHIEEVLDMQLLEQKMEHGAFDFRYYADFVIDLMAKLCAPVRDEEVAKLRDIQDTVLLFKEIFRVMELLKMDMANFTIQQMRPFIQQQSVEYERIKFQEFLKTQAENNMDGLQYTKTWITRSALRLKPTEDTSQGASASPVIPSPTPAVILNSAYLELLNWKDTEPFPETLLMDQSRFMDLRDKTEKITFVSAVMLVTYSTVGGPIAGIQDLKKKLKEEIFVILGDANPREYGDLILNVAEQVNKLVNSCLVQHGFSVPDESKQELLKGQVKETLSPDHPVHKVVRSRMLSFILELISAPRPGDLRVPPGLSAVSEELSQLCGQFLRLVSHNRAVFSPQYADIITSLSPPQDSLSAGD